MKNRYLSVAIGISLAAYALSASAENAGTFDAASQESEPQGAAVEATTLDSVRVVGTSYIETGTRSAMKMDVEAMDTPFSVSTYSDDFMDALETQNVADLYKYMTGVQKAGTSAQDITIRGFKSGGNDRNAMMINGLPGLTGRFASPPTIALERVDIVRGPASVLYGQAQPGGFVNLVTKKPSARAASEVRFRADTYSGGGVGFGDDVGYDVAFDTTGALDDENRFLYRFITQYHDKDTFRDFTFNKGVYVAPSLTWNMTDSTTATVELEYRKYKNAYDKFLPAPGFDIDRVPAFTNRYHQPDDFQRESGYSATVTLRHAFESGATWNFSLRYADSVDRAKAFDVVAIRPNREFISRRAVRNENNRDSLFMDTSFEIPFETGGISHQMIVGVNGGEDSTDLNRLQFFNGTVSGPTSLDISIANPVYTGYPRHEDLPATNPATPHLLTHRLTQSKAFGVYVADLITLSDQWKVNLGLRSTYDRQEIEELRIAGVAGTRKSSDKLLPQAGVLYQPSETLTFYGSYSSSYVPAAPNVIDVNGRNSFDPETSTQLEVGAKISSADGKLQATAAIFDIERTDSLTSFSCPLGTCSEQFGSQRSKGVELEMNARPLENWEVAMGFARADAKVSESRDPVQLGAATPNSAKNTAHVWTRYDVREGLLKGLGIGGGYAYVGERAGNLPSTANPVTMRLPAYSIADVSLFYRVGAADLTLKLGNLFDERYFESTGLLAETQVQPGMPRNISFSVRLPF